MRQLPVRLSENAIDTLTTLAAYIANQSGSLDVALAFTHRIEQRCHRIGLAPEGGAPRPEYGDGVRLVPFEKSAVILYRVGIDAVDILDVFYGGRDYDALMRDDLQR